jgi:hypothetical protein
VNLKEFIDTWLMKSISIIWLFSCFFILLLLSRIDFIVHEGLYTYGLQFNTAWAEPYWSNLRFIYVCLAIPSVLSAINLGSELFTKVSNKESSNPNKKSKSSMLISCPSCKRLFNKPMTMLGFSSGSAKLINICPYCSTVLGNSEETVEAIYY